MSSLAIAAKIMDSKEYIIALSPILKWAGGKRWLVPILVPIWEKYPNYRLVEPFSGSLAIALGLRPDRALLNDINIHLINLYSWMQRGFELHLPMVNTKRAFYSNRKEFNRLVSSGGEQTREAAELFYYLNRTCYNGLCRFNGKGEFNVPYGWYKKISYKSDFQPYQDVFSKWQFSNTNFADLIFHPNDFIYADPPYDVDFRSYSKEKFSWDQQVKLVEKLASHTGPVVISNQATPRILKLYGENGYNLVIYGAKRRISSNGDREIAKEVLAVKLPNIKVA